MQLCALGWQAGEGAGLVSSDCRAASLSSSVFPLILSLSLFPGVLSTCRFMKVFGSLNPTEASGDLAFKCPCGFAVLAQCSWEGREVVWRTLSVLDHNGGGQTCQGGFGFSECPPVSPLGVITATLPQVDTKITALCESSWFIYVLTCSTSLQ